MDFKENLEEVNLVVSDMKSDDAQLQTLEPHEAKDTMGVFYLYIVILLLKLFI